MYITISIICWIIWEDVADIVTLLLKGKSVYLIFNKECEKQGAMKT